MSAALDRLIERMASERTMTNPALWDDLVQEAKIAVWEVRQRDPLAAEGYLAAVARNRMNAVLSGRAMTGQPKHQGKRLVEPKDSDPLPVNEKGEQDQSMAIADRLASRLFLDVEEHVDTALLRQAVRCMPVADRTLVFGRFVLDETWEDAGQRIGLSGNRAQARFYDHLAPRLRSVLLHNGICLVCGTADGFKPMCFKGQPWCCDLHRKVVVGELTPEQAEEAMAGKAIRESDVMR